MFAVGLVLYAISSLLGGLAESAALLVTARAVQGVGGAFLFPATLTLVSTSFAEGRERNRAFAVWGTAGGSGMILGSLLGGVLTDAFGWESVFFVNVPLAGTAALLTFALIAPDAPRAAWPLAGRCRHADLDDRCHGRGVRAGAGAGVRMALARRADRRARRRRPADRVRRDRTAQRRSADAATAVRQPRPERGDGRHFSLHGHLRRSAVLLDRVLPGRARLRRVDHRAGVPGADGRDRGRFADRRSAGHPTRDPAGAGRRAGGGRCRCRDPRRDHGDRRLLHRADPRPGRARYRPGRRPTP